MDKSKKLLVIGYGNPGRGDDGLGPMFVDRLEKYMNHIKSSDDDPGSCDIDIILEEGFQLSPEYALNVSLCDSVVFVDADMSEECESFTLTSIGPGGAPAYTTHTISAEYVLRLCSEIFGKTTDAYKLAIKGYSWELGDEPSGKAIQNLEHALMHFQSRFLGNCVAEDIQ